MSRLCCAFAVLCGLMSPMSYAAAAEPTPIDMKPYVEMTMSARVVSQAGETAELRVARDRLALEVRKLLDGPRLVPLRVEPGLAGGESFFDHSGDTFRSLSLAYPWLPAELAGRVKQYLLAELKEYPPHTNRCWYPPNKGVRRELYRVPVVRLDEVRRDDPNQPFADLYALWAFACNVDAWSSVEPLWPQIDETYRQFVNSGWRLDPGKGDLHANRHLAGLIGYARLARRFGHQEPADDATRRAGELAAAIVADYRRGEKADFDQNLSSVAELDAWMRESGGVFFFAVGAHKRKIAKYLDLTPEVGRIIADHAMPAARHCMAFVDRSLPGWYMTGEERQFHFGENFIDYPDFAMSIFRAKALIHQVPAGELARYLDLPWCAGDLYYIEKLALILHREKPQ